MFHFTVMKFTTIGVKMRVVGSTGFPWPIGQIPYQDCLRTGAEEENVLYTIFQAAMIFTTRSVEIEIPFKVRQQRVLSTSSLQICLDIFETIKTSYYLTIDVVPVCGQCYWK